MSRFITQCCTISKDYLWLISQRARNIYGNLCVPVIYVMVLVSLSEREESTVPASDHGSFVVTERRFAILMSVSWSPFSPITWKIPAVLCKGPKLNVSVSSPAMPWALVPQYFHLITSNCDGLMRPQLTSFDRREFYIPLFKNLSGQMDCPARFNLCSTAVGVAPV